MWSRAILRHARDKPWVSAPQASKSVLLGRSRRGRARVPCPRPRPPASAARRPRARRRPGALAARERRRAPRCGRRAPRCRPPGRRVRCGRRGRGPPAAAPTASLADDGCSLQHGLVDDQPPRLGESCGANRRQHEHVGRRVERRQVRARQRSRAPGRRLPPARPRPRSGPAPASARRAPGPRAAARQASSSTRDPLLALEAADVEHEQLGARRRRALPRARCARPRRRTGAPKWSTSTAWGATNTPPRGAAVGLHVAAHVRAVGGHGVGAAVEVAGGQRARARGRGCAGAPRRRSRARTARRGRGRPRSCRAGRRGRRARRSPPGSGPSPRGRAAPAWVVRCTVRPGTGGPASDHAITSTPCVSASSRNGSRRYGGHGAGDQAGGPRVVHAPQPYGRIYRSGRGRPRPTSSSCRWARRWACGAPTRRSREQVRGRGRHLRASCGSRSGASGRLRRAMALTDVVEGLAAAARGPVRRGRGDLLERHRRAAAAARAPRTAVRFDATAALNRPGAGGAWQRRRERAVLAPGARCCCPGARPPARPPLRAARRRRAPPSVRCRRRCPSCRRPGEDAPDVVAYAGDPLKRGIDLLCEAWRRVRPAGGRLAVGGHRARRGAAPAGGRGRERAAGGGVAGRGGAASAGSRLVAGARVFVNASRLEDWGLAQMEALAAGHAAGHRALGGPERGPAARRASWRRSWWRPSAAPEALARRAARRAGAGRRARARRYAAGRGAAARALPRGGAAAPGGGRGAAAACVASSSLVDARSSAAAKAS